MFVVGNTKMADSLESFKLSAFFWRFVAIEMIFVAITYYFMAIELRLVAIPTLTLLYIF